MPTEKYTKIVVLVILSGLVAYRLLKSKRIQSFGTKSKQRMPLSGTVKTIRLKIPVNSKKEH